MLQRGIGERKFQKQMMVAERQEKEIKECCRGGLERKFQKQTLFALREGKGHFLCNGLEHYVPYRCL